MNNHTKVARYEINGKIEYHNYTLKLAAQHAGFKRPHIRDLFYTDDKILFLEDSRWKQVRLRSGTRDRFDISYPSIYDLFCINQSYEELIMHENKKKQLIHALWIISELEQSSQYKNSAFRDISINIRELILLFAL